MTQGWLALFAIMFIHILAAFRMNKRTFRIWTWACYWPAWLLAIWLGR